MTGDPETFWKGAAAFRNLRDWTEEERDGAIQLANNEANRRSADLSTSNISDASFVFSVATEITEEGLYTVVS